MQIEVSGETLARRWSALGVVVGDFKVITFGQPRPVALLGRASVAIGREAGNEAPVWLGRAAAGHGAVQGIQICRALLSHLGVIPSRRRIRALDGVTSGRVRKQHARWRRLATVLDRTLGNVGIEAGDIVCAV